MKNASFFLWFSLPVFLIFSACSCSTGEGIQKILGTSAEAPVFIDCRPVSSTEITFTFSAPVKVVCLNFDPLLEAGTITEEGREITVSFAGPLEEGQKITADILVEDSDKNTLNVIVPFRARNNHMPALVFNELRTEYSKPKVEFVEFLARGPGNLGAMRLFMAGYSLSRPVYEFSPAEVAAGEYIVLHLRNIEPGCADETGRDLALSEGTEAPKDARDIWIPGGAKLIHRTDALWLMDQDDRIIDAVLLSETSADEWSTKDKDIAAAAEFLGRKGAWLKPGESSPSPGGGAAFTPVPADAVSTAGTTLTRTICRDESIPPLPGAGNWYITATSNATPGKPNSTKRYP